MDILIQLEKYNKMKKIQVYQGIICNDLTAHMFREIHKDNRNYNIPSYRQPSAVQMCTTSSIIHGNT
uniref:Putative ovule protein n=1 Tax=Solanum chacoense TaxID=4108 RepID=A0A0V0H343_SOLCH